MRKIHVDANKNVHFEFEAGANGDTAKEIEVYVGGWFITSVSIADLTPEAKSYIFEEVGIENKGGQNECPK